MKINFTKKEFVALIEMIDIANWIISSHKIDKGVIEKPYEDLEAKIFALASEFGCDDRVKFYKELNRYCATHYFEMESPHRKFIDDYDDEVFWDEIIDRLATRDAIQEVGKEKYRDLDSSERISLFSRHEQIWAEEFETNGLENIAIYSSTFRKPIA